MLGKLPDDGQKPSKANENNKRELTLAASLNHIEVASNLRLQFGTAEGSSLKLDGPLRKPKATEAVHASLLKLFICQALDRRVNEGSHKRSPSFAASPGRERSELRHELAPATAFHKPCFWRPILLFLCIGRLFRGCPDNKSPTCWGLYLGP